MHLNAAFSLQVGGADLWWVSMMPSKSDTWSRSTKKASQLACRHSGPHLERCAGRPGCGLLHAPPQTAALTVATSAACTKMPAGALGMMELTGEAAPRLGRPTHLCTPCYRPYWRGGCLWLCSAASAHSDWLLSPAAIQLPRHNCGS